MGFKYFSISAAFFFLMSCAGGSTTSENKDTKEEEEDLYPIYVFLEDIMKKEGAEQLSSIASDIVYIPLETNNNSLLKDIKYIAYLGNKYVVSDAFSIYLFDNEGKFIKQVARQGGGPADFPSAVFYIIVDPKTKNFYVSVTKKILKFDENANYKGNIKIDEDDAFLKGVFTDNNTMVLGLTNYVWTLGDTTTIYNAIEVDTQGNVLKKYINNSPRYSEVVRRPLMTPVTSIYTFKNETRIFDWGHDTIYSIVNDTIFPYAILDLGVNKTNYNPDFSNIEPSKLNEMLESFNGHAIANVFENDVFLFMYLTEKGISRNEINCIYNKRTKELKLLKDNAFINDLDGGISFFPKKALNDNEFFNWKSAETFREEILSKDYNTQKAKYGDRFEKTYQLAKSLKDDDNPVIVIAKK